MENSPENKRPSTSENDEDLDCLKAGTVYIIVKKSYFIPRSLRIQWYLQHLNTKIRITRDEKNRDDETVVASIVPEEPTIDWSTENGHLFEYLVTLSTNVIFLGEVNRVVYCLDISPSVSSVDSQYGEVLLDVIIESLQKSITSLVNSFDIPGSSHKFKPDIFITVIAHTPFFISPAQQVLVQGWKITEENLNEFLGAVLRQLEFIEDEVARVSGSVHEQFEIERKNSTESENFNDGSLNEDAMKQFVPVTPSIAMVSPGSGFLNLLRFGMLALKLLPTSNFSNLVVITDGMIAMPDSDTLDSVLNHMRYNDISCNFIHVGSHFHPHCGFGFVPYAEIMQLISVATNGSYFQFSPYYKQQNGLNIYQQNFLTWSLKRKSVVLELSTPHAREGDWTVTNSHFYGNRRPQLLTKKYLENNINVTLYGVLACRIREGFILDKLDIKDNELIIDFVLPWTNHIYIEYTSSCQWPVITSPSISTHFVINIKAPYEFLHDISCHMKTPIKSPFRQALIARFWRSLKSFAQSDLLLSHLESFMNTPGSYFLPEGLRKGLSLYYLMTGSCQPVLISSDNGFTKFGDIWRPACLLNNNLWQKWFHADRVGIIFQHDELINLFSDRTKKCSGVQCRWATNTLFTFLKEYCSFILIENHSFIKFLLPSESGTGKHSFYVIRSICKPPYAVIHIAFLYDIPGSVRSKIIREFKVLLSELKISRPLQKESSYDLFASDRLSRFGNAYTSSPNCCIVLEKPLEKILIRYEQMPSEFSTVVFPDGTQPSNKAQNPLSSNRGLITTLSRYLHHRRWIWKANIDKKIFLPVQALENILSTLVKIRLQEGFYFAHFSAGICNMVLEVQMKGSTKENLSADGIYYNCHEDNESEEMHSCVIQYVLFPPRFLETPTRESEDPDSKELSVIELVSECWIEPQHGVITNCPPTRSYMSNLQYHQLPDAIWSIDAKCISALCTFEHLKLMCHSPGVEAPDSIQHLLSKSSPSAYWPNVAPFEDQRINHIPFPYTVPNLLCQSVQENLLYNIFSIDLLDKSESSGEPNKLLLDSVYNHLSTVHSKELLICGQDAQYLIKNFRRSSRCSEKRNMTSWMMDLEEPLTPNLPSSRDWDRMICWALGRSDSNDSDKRETLTSSRNSVYPGRHDAAENECKFRRSFMSDFNGSHHSSNFDISSISYLENVDWLKWKCYVKFVSKSQCIVTVLPAGLDVIKRIALDHEQKNSQVIEPSRITSDNVSVCCDAESYVTENADDVSCSPIVASNQAKVDTSSVYTSCSFSSKDLIGEDSVYDETADMSTELAKDSEINTPYRLRASTWDPVRRIMDSHMSADDRLRTNSVGARVRPLTRLRPKRSFDFESKEKLHFVENANKVTKFVPLILPVYVYNCTMPDVINYLIYKDKYAHFERQQDVSFENTDSLDDTLTQLRKNYQDSALGEYNLDEQCASIDSLFTKFFVFSLFKCLHHGYEIPLSDVEQGFSKCETSVLTIDITDYLKVVCRHLRNLVPANRCPEEDQTPSKCVLPVQNFLSSGVCNELRFIHRLIKKKFANILTSDFKPIPSKPEFYYFFPSWTKESKPSSAGILSPGFTENNSSGVSVDQIMPVTSANILGINTWDTCKESVNSEDNACTSLISNMDSDSLNEISNESLMDDVNPLFLRVDCKISSNGRVAKCSLHLIPTCICEVLKCLDKSFSDVDINDLKVTLELLYLTSPFTDVKKKPPKAAETSKGSGFADETNKVNVYEDVEALSFDEGRVPRQIMSLPDYQYNALNTCIAQMKWLIKDEIITFMLDTSPVTSETLKMVCQHIESSPNAATCFIEKVPLSFVFGNEATSLNNFLEAFDSMKIPYYRLKKEDNMYYLVKDCQERNRIKDDRKEKDEIENAASKFLTSSMEILAEEQENFFQVFSSGESISENESIKIVNNVQRQESITDAEEDNNRMLQSTVQWILDRDCSNGEMPNFWLIMTITNNYVIVYFHCRFLEINKKEIKDYVLVRESVISNIKDLCKVVNQKMLLNSLHDTRVCDQLLEPDPQNDDSENEAPNPSAEINYAFVPGYFACNVVWETKFILHPRLKMSQLKGSISRGIQALCSALIGFSVTNRKNLFVYQDVNKNVFYLRLYEFIHGVLKPHEGEETSSGSFSRSSSFTSLNRKHFDEHLPFMLDETKSRNKSVSDNNESSMCKAEDYIALRVYGITETGTDIKNDLVQVLQNRLDDAVLDVISVMLSRNPLCKLLSEDVHFIQKPYQHPNAVLQFNVDIWVLKYLYTFRYLIKQNIQQFASSPKYSDPRSSYHFQDYSVPEDSPKRVSESNIFLYNQSPACGKGIACLAVAIVDGNDEAIECNDDYDPNIRYTLNFFSIEELKSMTDVRQGSNESGNCVKVEFRIWKQGRINMESLEPKLMSVIKHSLWELVMEKISLVYPLFDGDSDRLFRSYYSVMPNWISFGTELAISSVRVWDIALPIKLNLPVVLKELNQIFSPYETACYAFYKHHNLEKEEIFTPCTNFNEVMWHVGDTCLMIGRSMTHVQNALDHCIKMNLEPMKSDKGLQRLPSTTQDDSFMTVTKQRFVLFMIANSKITMYAYNWPKDKIDSITKLLTSLSEWIVARSYLLTSIVEQKMGIFFNHPLQRANISKKVIEMAKLDMNVLFKFPMVYQKNSNGLPLFSVNESFRDVKLPNDLKEKLADKNPFTQNVNHLTEVFNINKKSNQNNLFSSWQLKGSNSNIPVDEEMLNNFLLHGRFVHFCLTPLLFMPRWRVAAAATRDHSLSLKTQSLEKTEESLPSDDDEKWHTQICSNFIHEYKQYLQCLGFFPIQPTESFSKKLNAKANNGGEDKNVHYMQKFPHGGVLLFELFFAEPFFNAKLYALDYSMLKTKSSSLLSQFATSFLDECDRIKFQMHLHSFTYDYHLRCLHEYIADRQPLLRHGYHIIEFLDDFIKYYPKASNYARSLVHAENITVANVTISPPQLFDYLLTHGKNYDMVPFCMVPQNASNGSTEGVSQNQYVLIQNKHKSGVSYKDANDVQQTDDFDITVVISYINGDELGRTMQFQVYILLTTRRELYPKVEVEQKLGKFRTVSTSHDHTSSSEDVNMKFTIEPDGSSSSRESQDSKDTRKKKSLPFHVEIKQELVNYLGYYSSHEEVMQNLMHEEVEEAKKFIEWMVVQGAFDCETHMLWNKLLCSLPVPLTYPELQHLLSLAEVLDISNMDGQLEYILKQPISWFQSFIKAVMAKLPECCHLFSSPNNTTQELLILHPQYSNGFLMIVLNFQASTAAMYLVYRRDTSSEDEARVELQTLFEQIINMCCFHLWLDAL